jgi:pSer/pThr/pTyr-binding forkhead associated (FHA) protein
MGKGGKVPVKTSRYAKSAARNKAGGVHENATLTIENGCFAGLAIPITKKRMVLGNDLDCDIYLDDPRVTEQHAAIRKNGPDYTLTDLETSSGTAINGKRITEAALRSGDVITIGGFRIRFSS